MCFMSGELRALFMLQRIGRLHHLTDSCGQKPGDTTKVIVTNESENEFLSTQMLNIRYQTKLFQTQLRERTTKLIITQI